MKSESEKICPLVNGKCIGASCMSFEEHTKGDTNGLIVHWEKHYTCKLFGVELDIKEK